MLKQKIIYNFFVRVFILVSGFLTLIFTSRTMGPEIRGTASLIMAALAILLQINTLAGGASLIAISKISNIRNLVLKLFYLYIAGGLLLMPFVILSGYFTWNESVQIAIISILYAGVAGIQCLLLGKNRINEINILLFIQSFFPFAGSGYCVYSTITGEKALQVYIVSLFLAGLFPIFFGLYSLRKEFSSHSGEIYSVSYLFKKGIISQLSNIIQQLNYRYSFYIAGAFIVPSGLLGEYTVAVSLTEALWTGGRTLATVLTGLSTENENYAEKKVIRFSILSVVFSLLGSILLYILPTKFYIQMLGENYVNVKEYINYLLPATIIFSSQFGISSYFAGLGKFNPANQASVISFIFLLFLCPVLTEKYGLIGTASATTLCYLISSCIFYYYFLKRNTHV